MTGHPKLPDYEPIAPNSKQARNAIHRAETLALWAEEVYEAGNSDDAGQLAAIANAWATIAIAVQANFGGAS